VWSVPKPNASTKPKHANTKNTKPPQSGNTNKLSSRPNAATAPTRTRPATSSANLTKARLSPREPPHSARTAPTASANHGAGPALITGVWQFGSTNSGAADSCSSFAARYRGPETLVDGRDLSRGEHRALVSEIVREKACGQHDHSALSGDRDAQVGVAEDKQAVRVPPSPPFKVLSLRVGLLEPPLLDPVDVDPPATALRLDREESTRAYDNVIHVPPTGHHIMDGRPSLNTKLLKDRADPLLTDSTLQPPRQDTV